MKNNEWTKSEERVIVWLWSALWAAIVLAGAL